MSHPFVTHSYEPRHISDLSTTIAGVLRHRNWSTLHRHAWTSHTCVTHSRESRHTSDMSTTTAGVLQHRNWRTLHRHAWTSFLFVTHSCESRHTSDMPTTTAGVLQNCAGVLQHCHWCGGEVPFTFECVAHSWLIHMSHVTHLMRQPLLRVHCGTVIGVLFVVTFEWVTRCHVRHDPFIRMTWSIHLCGTIHSCECHNSFLCLRDSESLPYASWLIRVCVVTLSFFLKNIFCQRTESVTSFSRQPYSCLCRDSFMCLTRFIHWIHDIHKNIVVAKNKEKNMFFNRTCSPTEYVLSSCIWHDSFTQGTFHRHSLPRPFSFF